MVTIEGVAPTDATLLTHTLVTSGGWCNAHIYLISLPPPHPRDTTNTSLEQCTRTLLLTLLPHTCCPLFHKPWFNQAFCTRTLLSISLACLMRTWSYYRCFLVWCQVIDPPSPILIYISPELLPIFSRMGQVIDPNPLSPILIYISPEKWLKQYGCQMIPLYD